LRNIILLLAFLCLTVGCTSPPAVQVVTAATQPQAVGTCPPAAQPLPGPTVQATDTPTPTPTQTPDVWACLKEAGRIELIELNSTILNRPVVVRLYLPPCFDQQRTQPYPLLVLLHGQSGNDDQWDRLGAGDSAQKLIAAKQSQPFIIAMPREEYYLQEMNTSFFGQMIVDELLPYLASTYHTCTIRECTAIGGISRGAMWAFRVGATHPDLFGAIGGHSLPGGVYETSFKLRKLTREQRPKLYLDSGGADRYLKSAIAFEQTLTSLGIAHEWHLNSGAHDEIYWQAHTAEYMSWYSQMWLP
jgi:enterochelin esterase-like enzyme